MNQNANGLLGNGHEDIIIHQNDGNIHKIVSSGIGGVGVGAAKSQPRNYKAINSGDQLYRTQDVPNIANVRPMNNKINDTAESEGNMTLVMAKAPTIQARDINRMGNTAKPIP